MIARMMELKCAGGPHVTKADKIKNASVNLGGTFFLALVWLALVWVWREGQLSGSVYVMSVSPMTYLFPYLVGLRYTSLKGRSPQAQTILIVGLSATLTTFLLLVGWISTKL
jgi:hypothetical protein